MDELHNTCLQVRVGENNDGDTLEEALNAVLRVGAMSTDIAAGMLKAIIPQARKGGVCNDCINFLKKIEARLS